MKYQSIKKNNLQEYNKPVFIIGNGPSLAKINLYSLKNEITVGVNAIYYSGFSPTFICITDATIIQKYPLEQLFGCYYSKYILRSDLYTRYKNKIDKVCQGHRIYLVNLINTDFLSPEITDFDREFKNFNVSYSVMIDLAIPLLIFLGVKNIYLLGIDNKNFIHHSYDHRFNYISPDIPNPRNINNYTEEFQSQDLELRYKKVSNILKNNYPNTKIYNCGIDSNLEVFPRKDITKEIDNIIKDIDINEIANKIISIKIKNMNKKFLIVNGNIPSKLPNITLVSLLSLENGCNYLKCVKKYLKLEPYKQEPLYYQQTTFYIEKNINNSDGYSFRSYYYPHSFIVKNVDNFPSLEIYNIIDYSQEHYFYKLYNYKYFFDSVTFKVNNNNETFIIVNGNLNYKTTISFRWIKFPVNFLRIYTVNLTINPYLNHKQYLYDTSFYIMNTEDDKYILKSCKYPDKFLSNDENGLLCLDNKPFEFTITQQLQNNKLNILNNKSSSFNFLLN